MELSTRNPSTTHPATFRRLSALASMLTFFLTAAVTMLLVRDSNTPVLSTLYRAKEATISYEEAPGETSAPVAPLATPTPMVPMDDLPTAEECDRVKRSLSTCGSRALPLVIRNDLRIPVTISKVKADGTLKEFARLLPGTKRTIPRPCNESRYVAETDCLTCAGAASVIDAEEDTYWLISRMAAEAHCPPKQGSWGAVTDWPLIPVAMANLPDGRVMGMAARNANNFQGMTDNEYKTLAAIYDPVSGKFESKDLEGHDLFCAAMTSLRNGHIFVAGGGEGNNSYKVSTYDPLKGEWMRHADMERPHWYGTAVATNQDKKIFVALGTDREDHLWDDANAIPELSAPGFRFDENWTSLTGADMTGKHPELTHWYPQMHLLPNGRILESGTMNEMYTIDTRMKGEIQSAGLRNKDEDELESWGTSTIYYAEHKLLTLGGMAGYSSKQSSSISHVYKRAIRMKINVPRSIKTMRVADMTYNRSFQNTVVFPTGEVFVVGGQYGTAQWDDTYSVYQPEMWNPKNNKWTLLSPHKKPRNYHSTAILLRDGRVLSAGGGLCGWCDGRKELNHQDHQIFSPPYLFNQDGSEASRPVIHKVAKTLQLGRSFNIQVRGSYGHRINRFSIIKLSTVTHSLSTDLRQIRLERSKGEKLADDATTPYDEIYRYETKLNGNPNVVLPGYWYLFAVNVRGVPSMAKIVRITL